MCISREASQSCHSDGALATEESRATAIAPCFKTEYVPMVSVSRMGILYFHEHLTIRA